MRYKTVAFLAAGAAVALVVGFAVSATWGQPSGVVVFVDDSLTMSPQVASEGTRVTFTFNVRNNGAQITNVQIRVIEPANARGQGTVIADVGGQVINAGLNTYRVTGVFRMPTSAENENVYIQLLDRRTRALPAPVIAHSGARHLVLGGYKLDRLVPLI
jgi:hypothetical protein